jgi:6-pyruvoyltetrahydropterin/6-carboxytetrahydropterin synthase
MESYHVRVAGDDLAFSAGHFITLGAGTCEAAHGHDYRVAAEVWGPLDENRCVVDFVALRQTLASIVAELDHRMLLPTQHPSIRVDAGPNEVEVAFAGRRWIFPKSDCVLLPVDNTTAELLARHIAGRLLDGLAARGCPRPGRLRVEVGEGRGQSAFCQLTEP